LVAEGVETIDQLRLLALAGCGSAQGFLFAKPMAANAVAPFIEFSRKNSDKLESRVWPAQPRDLDRLIRLPCRGIGRVVPTSRYFLGQSYARYWNFDSFRIKMMLYSCLSAMGVPKMPALAKNRSDAEILPLWNAVFCLDCEVISSSRGDECPACKSRSLVSLARMLGGSLLAHRALQFQKRESGLFDITITIELKQMHGKDLRIMLERLATVIGPKLARDRSTFHIDVKPAVDRVNLQDSLHFPEREAA
jgi:hypothetical protein